MMVRLYIILIKIVCDKENNDTCWNGLNVIINSVAVVVNNCKCIPSPQFSACHVHTISVLNNVSPPNHKFICHGVVTSFGNISVCAYKFDF